MKFLENLEWQNQAQDFSENQLKVLAVLSDQKYKWRSADNIAAIPGFETREVVSILDSLIHEGWVHASISIQDKTVVFGLTERIGPEKFGIKTGGKFPARVKLR